MADKLAAQWARIRGRLRAEYGEAAYGLAYAGVDDGSYVGRDVDVDDGYGGALKKVYSGLDYTYKIEGLATGYTYRVEIRAPLRKKEQVKSLYKQTPKPLSMLSKVNNPSVPETDDDNSKLLAIDLV